MIEHELHKYKVPNKYNQFERPYSYSYTGMGADWRPILQLAQGSRNHTKTILKPY